jgi:hypothetical protein
LISVKAFLRVTLVLALAACSVRQGAPGYVPAVADVRVFSSAAHATVSFTIHWPTAAGKAKSNLLRRPFFISPSAKSFRIDVAPADSSNPKAITSTFVNRPARETTTTITFAAPIGEDDFVFGDYDQPNAKGNKLGGAEVFEKIGASGVNKISATLSGYAAGVRLTTSSPWLSPKTSTNLTKYTLVGDQANEVAVSPLDADGNVIVPPGIEPIATMSSTDPSIAVALVSGKPNVFIVQAVSLTAKSNVPALQVDVTSGASGSQEFETSFPISEEDAVYATSGKGATAKMTVFDQNGNTIQTSGTFSGLNEPVALAYDTADHRVYVADAASQTIQAYDGEGNPVAGWTAPKVTGIASIVWAYTTQLVYATTTANGGGIDAFDSTGQGGPVPAGEFAGVSHPTALAYSGPSNFSGGVFDQIYVAGSTGNVTTVGTYQTETGETVPIADPDPTTLPPGVSVAAMAGLNPFVIGSSPKTAYACDLSFYIQGFSPIGKRGPPSAWVSPPNAPHFCATNGLTSPTSLAYSGLTHNVYVANGTGGLVRVVQRDSRSGLIGTEVLSKPAFPPPSQAHNFSTVTTVY